MSRFPWKLGDEGEGSHNSNCAYIWPIRIGENPIAQGHGLWVSGGLKSCKTNTHQKFDFFDVEGERSWLQKNGVDDLHLEA